MKIKKTANFGGTLAEVLITCVLFFIVLVLLSSILVSNLRHFKAGEAETFQVKSVRKSMQHISQILRETQAVRNEDALKMSAGSSEIIFNYRNEVCSFKYNEQTKEVEFFKYKNYGTSQQEIIPESIRAVSLKNENIKSLNFKIENYQSYPHLITIEISANPQTSGGVIFSAKTKLLY